MPNAKPLSRVEISVITGFAELQRALHAFPSEIILFDSLFLATVPLLLGARKTFTIVHVGITEGVFNSPE